MLNKFLTLSLVILILISNIGFSQDDFFSSSSSIGGYGELHYNRAKTDDKTTNVLDFHRFVLFYGHQWSEKWSLKAEVELEHNFVAGDQGELELEQAVVDYHFKNYLGFQAGVLLPSVGLINEMHEPPLFFGVERPDYHKSIIPTTWFGNGFSIYGIYNNIDYKLTVMEGLDADKINAGSGIRNARQKGYKAKADNLLYNARLNYLGINGVKVGASFTTTSAMGEDENILVSLFEGHFQLVKNNIYLRAEAASISYDNGDLEGSFGYYVDLGYDFSKVLKTETKVIPFLRYTNYNTASSTAQGGDSEQEYNKTKWMIGINILPIDEVVLKVDYGETTVELSDATTKYFNLGVGYMF